jgi:hypothetical protein
VLNVIFAGWRSLFGRDETTEASVFAPPLGLRALEGDSSGGEGVSHRRGDVLWKGVVIRAVYLESSFIVSSLAIWAFSGGESASMSRTRSAISERVLSKCFFFDIVF